MYAISYKNISIFGHNCHIQNFRVPRKGRCNSVLFLIADDIMVLNQDVWVGSCTYSSVFWPSDDRMVEIDQQ